MGNDYPYQKSALHVYMMYPKHGARVGVEDCSVHPQVSLPGDCWTPCCCMLSLLRWQSVAWQQHRGNLPASLKTPQVHPCSRFLFFHPQSQRLHLECPLSWSNRYRPNFLHKPPILLLLLLQLVQWVGMVASVGVGLLQLCGVQLVHVQPPLSLHRRPRP